MVETLFWVAGMVAIAAWVAVKVRRKAKPQPWQERPCRNYDPALDDEVKP